MLDFLFSGYCSVDDNLATGHLDGEASDHVQEGPKTGPSHVHRLAVQGVLQPQRGEQL